MKNMWKRIKFVIFLLIIVFFGYGAYDYYQAGYHNRPDMPEGAFSISYKNGLRAIIINVPDKRNTRRYFGFPSEVPFYLKDSWSFCYPPTNKERNEVELLLARHDWPGERLEAICKLDVDNEEVIRGIITSVPKV